MDELLKIVTIVWRIFVRRKWTALILAWIVGVAGWVGISALPDKYQSDAQIYVDTSTLLGPLLKGIAVQGNIQQQVAVMQRTLFSRPNLEKVVRDNDLDLEVHSAEDMERLLTKVEDNANIKSGGPNLFIVSYTNKDPGLARNITQSFLDIFVSTNVGQSRVGMETAKSFIEAQIARYESQLRDAEEELAQFKVKNSDFLAKGDFFKRYETVRKEYREMEQALVDAEVVTRQLEKQLTQTPRFLEVEDSTASSGGRKEQSSAEKALEDAQEDLTSLQSRFTDQHPDVIAAKRVLDDAQKRVDKEKEEIAAGGEDPTVRKTRVPNGIYEQIQVRLFETAQTKARLEEQFSRIKAEFEVMDEQKSSAPEIEAQLAGLNRDYDVIKKQYEELLVRRESVNISAARETSTDAVQFRIIEPPKVPILPAGPNRPLLTAAVLVFALGIGAGLPILLGFASGYIHSSRNLEDTYDYPVLGTVGYVSGAMSSMGRLVGRLLFLGGLIGLLGLGGAFFVIKPNPDMILSIASDYGILSLIDGSFAGFVEKISAKIGL
ncbi:XrtA system polysaccharide chain length determinant [Aestuariispira insulae]|uniref:Polysaccharide chain length determinant protein (PEP-CTERM system associated) n=1 Tax=Aestuariispira insulae TaxID=1461337 RepID=A0A3D9HLU9_9PROT|nr:XrtA system polysaccharide chain length determinant [Aestuariispira insulae]RED49876.1 polysaccharide chain length determinant protein (PEP-CTERM system associated) [Aestuariispira insulae]